MAACYHHASHRYIATGINRVIIRIGISAVIYSILLSMTVYASDDFFFVCICKQISDIESKMGRREKELSNDVIEIAQKLFKEGETIDYVSNTLHILRSTVGSLKKHIEQRGSIENIPRRGMTPSVTARNYRKLERLVKVNRRDKLQDITSKFNENMERLISKRTLQFHLHKNWYRRSVSKKKVVVKYVNRRKRLSWCREKQKIKEENYWKKVISDESKIVVGQYSRVYVWRKRGEGWRPDWVGAQKT